MCSYTFVCVCVCVLALNIFVDDMKMKFMTLEESWGGPKMWACFWVREGAKGLLVGVRVFTHT